MPNLPPISSIPPTSQKTSIVKKVSHMIPFAKEKCDWKVCLKTLVEAQAQLEQGGIRYSWINPAINIAHQYSERHFPSYQMHKFPTSFQATDSVIIDRESGKILLGQKKNQTKWRFIGGFVDPKDMCLEDAASREKTEESGEFSTTSPEYLCSFRVNDPRYADSPDKIMSAVFISYFLTGVPKAGDDIKELKWITKYYLLKHYKKIIVPEHYLIVESLISKGLL